MVMVAGSENLAATDGAHAMYVFTSYLVSTVGWTITAQSDGSGAAITHAGTGAGGFDNNFAYRELQDPGTSRRISFQRSDTANTHWRSLLIEPGGSSGGSSTEVPTATGDSAIGWGAGTNASPTFDQVFTAGAFTFHGVADNAAYGSTGIYPMWFCAHAAGDTKVVTNFLYDACEVYHPSDTSPLLYFSRYATTTAYGGFAVHISQPGAGTTLTTHAGTTTGGKVVAFMGPSASATNLGVATTNTGTNFWTNSYTTAGAACSWAWDNTIPKFPIFAGTLATTPSVGVGLKGIYASWKGVSTTSMGTGDTLDVTTADPWVIIGHIGSTGIPPAALRWIQNTAFNLSP